MSMAGVLARVLLASGDRVSTRAIDYDGAGGGRRLRHAGEMPLPLPRRCRAHAAGAPGALPGRVERLRRRRRRAWEAALVGSGIKPQSAHPVPEVRTKINAAFNEWTRHADADGLLDFYGLQALAARRLVTDGECFASSPMPMTSCGFACWTASR